jgi:UDP-glucose 4-epimerase
MKNGKCAKMKILVTGNSGYIGRQLAATLRKRDFKVVGLDLRHAEVDYETVDFDLTKPDLPDVSGVDVIFHLAADTECRNEDIAFKINVEGTEKMLELAKKEKSVFIFASTGGVYGFGKKPFKESDKPSPYDPYTRTKIQAEELCRKYSRYFSVCILRYFFPYGAGGNRRLINRLVKKIQINQVIDLNINGKPVINPVAMPDAMDATIKSMELKGFNIINIGGKEEVSILDIVNLIEKEANQKAKIRYNRKKVEDLVGDISKAKELLNFEPKIDLKQGIRNLIFKL